MSCLTPIYSNCITFTAGLTARLKALGYSSTTFEDLLVEIIQKGGNGTTQQLADLQKVVEGLSTATIPAGAKTFGLHSGSVDAAQMTQKFAAYKVTGTELEYDMSAIKAGLPSGLSYLNAGVTAYAGNDRVSIRGTKAKVALPSVPANVIFSFQVQGKNGMVTLEKPLYISGDAEGTALLSPRDLNEAPADLTQQQFNELIAAEVVALKQRL